MIQMIIKIKNKIFSQKNLKQSDNQDDSKQNLFLKTGSNDKGDSEF